MRFKEMIGEEGTLNSISVEYLVGRIVRLNGFVESGEFDVIRRIEEIEFIRKIRSVKGGSRSSMVDLKIVPGMNGRDLDFSCITRISIMSCPNPDCKSNTMDYDDEKITCGSCGYETTKEDQKIWTVYDVKASSDVVRLSRV